MDDTAGTTELGTRWLAAAASIVLFASACSLFSRITAGLGETYVVNIFLGAGTCFVVGLAFILWLPKPNPRLVGGIPLVSVGAMALIVIANVLLGSAASFSFIHNLLFLAMVNSVVSCVMVSKWLMAHGAGLVAAAAAGLAVCIVNPSITEGCAVILNAAGADSEVSMLVAVSFLLASTLALMVTCLPMFYGSRARTEGAGTEGRTQGNGDTGENAASGIEPALGSDALELLVVRFSDDHGLTGRERAVLGCIVEGLTNQQIADRLSVTRGTVKTHVSHLMTKLGTSNRQELVEAVLSS